MDGSHVGFYDWPLDELRTGGVLPRTRMKHVGLFLGASPTHGGVFQYSDAILEAVAAMPAADYTIVVKYLDPAWAPVVHSYGIRGQMISRNAVVRVMDAILWRLPLPVSMWRVCLARLHSITRALAQSSCDIWIFPGQDIWTYLAPVAALGTVHDLMHRYESQFPEVSARGIYRQRERHYRRMCYWAKGIMVDSSIGRQQLVESYPVDPRKVFVLPFIAPRHVRTPASQSALPRSLPVKYFFYPAQFWQHKNHVRLLRGVNIVRERHPDVRIVFVGARKNGYAAVRAEVASLGLDEHVTFLDYVPDADMPELYRRARALVMPTFFGPTNIPQLEAFVLGCPVVTSRIYGIPEQVGDAALLFDPNSTDEIAATLERLWSDDALCADLVELGYLRAASWGSREFAKTLQRIVESALAEPSPA